MQTHLLPAYTHAEPGAANVKLEVRTSDLKLTMSDILSNSDIGISKRLQPITRVESIVNESEAAFIEHKFEQEVKHTKAAYMAAHVSEIQRHQLINNLRLSLSALAAWGGGELLICPIVVGSWKSGVSRCEARRALSKGPRLRCGQP